MIEVITIVVLLYGVLEYFRREKQHREALEYLKENRAPRPPRDRPPMWRLLVTGVAGLPVFAFGAWLVISGISQGEKGLPLLIFGLLLIPILVMLGLMLRRDAKAYSGVISEDEGSR
ncbi:MAG: hypothetical protein WBG01_03600 [Bacteroidota bacterium]